MSTFLLESDLRAGVPCPEVILHGFKPSRGLSLLGGSVSLPLEATAGLRVEAYDGEEPGLSDYMLGIGFVVVSTRMRSVLEEARAAVEFLPISLVHKGRVRLDYSILRALRVVRGVNMATSIAELDNVGVALSVDRLVLDDHAFAGLPFALVHELAQFAVSTELSQNIQSSGCVGCTLVEPNSFRL